MPIGSVKLVIAIKTQHHHSYFSQKKDYRGLVKNCHIYTHFGAVLPVADQGRKKV